MKYFVSIVYNNVWEKIAEFSNKVDFEAVYDFCISQFSNGNSLDAPADNIAIMDANTGEIVWDFNSDIPSYVDDNFDNEVGYDPYLGCYTDDC